jgi:hypothetical protein
MEAVPSAISSLLELMAVADTAHTASESDVKLKSFTRMPGIT